MSPASATEDLFSETPFSGVTPSQTTAAFLELASNHVPIAEPEKWGESLETPALWQRDLEKMDSMEICWANFGSIVRIYQSYLMWTHNLLDGGRYKRRWRSDSYSESLCAHCYSGTTGIVLHLFTYSLPSLAVQLLSSNTLSFFSHFHFVLSCLNSALSFS